MRLFYIDVQMWYGVSDMPACGDVGAQEKGESLALYDRRSRISDGTVWKSGCSPEEMLPHHGFGACFRA